MTSPPLLASLAVAALLQAAPALAGKLDCDAPDTWSEQDKKVAAKLCPKLAKKKADQEASAKEKEAKYEKFVKGHAGFEAVYASHGKRLPTSSKKVGGKVVWTYMTYTTNALHSQCEEFVFDEDGDKQLSTRTYTCD